MFSTILVPLDGSDLAVAALPAAKAMAAKFGSKLVLLTVVETGGATLALGANAAAGAMTDPAAITTEVDAHVEVAKAYLSATVEQLAEEGLTADYEVRDGSPGGAVVDAAVEVGAELIVMSSHGRSGLRRLVFGSVADHVVREAAMPVMIIRAK